MEVPRLYIQQLIYDGTTYVQGSVIDVLSQWNVGVTEFPFVIFPESKDVASRDWKGTDGVESYIPTGPLPVKDYDLEVKFLYSGTKESIKNDLSGFINFLYGRGSVGQVANVGCGRLAIYDEHVAIGRKDVRVVSISPDLYWNEDCDDETIATFTIKFHVDDPITDVSLVKTGNVVTGFTWSGLSS